MLRLHTFGGCFLVRDGVRLDALSGQRKALALLAVLAAAGARGTGREALLAALWPDSDQERARLSLNQLVHSLRQQLGVPDLLLTPAELRLNPARIATDVAEFRDALERGSHEAAVGLYAGPFLDGFYLRGADGFERWAATERAELANGAARVLEALAEHASARGDAPAAVAWWRRLAQAEPLSARAATGLMGALEMAGERAAALRHARVYELLVAEEVGGAPEPSVLDLVARLQQEPHAAAAPAAAGRPAPSWESPPGMLDADVDAPAVATAGAVQARRPRGRHAVALATTALLVAALAGYAAWADRAAMPAAPTSGAATHRAGVRGGPTLSRPSVAVLPFANTSGDPADEPFADGLTDELIGALGKVAGLTVAGRTSAFALKGKRLDVRAVAETLGVGAVLEGSVRRAGGRLKVNVQLANAADGAVLWAETYDREVADVFAVQEEIARAIVAALRGRLAASGAGGVGARLVARPTADLATYELYLRGRYILHTRASREALRQAIRYFEQAIALDPDYARAHAGLSQAYVRLAIFGFGRPDEAFARAKGSARQALARDSTLAEAHVALAHALLVHDFDWAASERGFRRGIALDPADADARHVFALALQDQGRFDEALAQLDTARAADPLAPLVSVVLGRVYVNARRPAEAIRHLEEALALSPDLDLAYQQLGHAYLQQGRPADAITALRRAAALSGLRDSAHLAYAYGVTGQRGEAGRVLGALLDPAARRAVPPFHLAMAYAGLGDADAAYAERGSFMDGVKVTPAFASLHADPRWRRLLQRMGLEP